MGPLDYECKHENDKKWNVPKDMKGDPVLLWVAASLCKAKVLSSHTGYSRSKSFSVNSSMPHNSPPKPLGMSGYVIP